MNLSRVLLVTGILFLPAGLPLLAGEVQTIPDRIDQRIQAQWADYGIRLPIG